MIRPPVRALAVGLLATLLTMTGCAAVDTRAGDGRSTEASSSSASAGSATDTTSAGDAYDPATGPGVGTCLNIRDTHDVFAPDAVPCDQPHTVEVFDVTTVKAKYRKDFDDVIPYDAYDCTPWRKALGYAGDLQGSFATAAVLPAPAARRDGANWVACAIGVADYDHATNMNRGDATKPSGVPKTPFLPSTGKLLGSITTDTGMVTSGQVCIDVHDGNKNKPCVAGKGLYVLLTAAHGVKPFVSAEHQGAAARSRCAALGYAYTVGHTGRWWAYWPTTADRVADVSQYCLVAYDDFDTGTLNTTAPVSDTQDLIGAEAAFARDLTAYAEAVSRNAEAMRLPTRADMGNSNFFDLLNDIYLRTWPDPGRQQESGTSRRGVAFTHRITVGGYSGRECRGEVYFPLPYLYAPFAVRGISCS